MGTDMEGRLRKQLPSNYIGVQGKTLDNLASTLKIASENNTHVGYNKCADVMSFHENSF